MKTAFQMEPLSAVNPAVSTSLLLMAEGLRRGYETYHFEHRNLSLTANKITAKAAQVKNINLESADFFSLGEPEIIDCSEFSSIHMRQDPPLDMAYVTNTYILERLAPKTLVVNNPVAVRNLPEKIFPLQFPEFLPPTLISGDIGEIQKFLNQQGKIIIKPIYSFAGDGIFLLDKDDKNLSSLLEVLQTTYKTPLIIQKYLSQIKDGEKTMRLIDGKFIGIFKKLLSIDGVRANGRFGGGFAKAEPTGRDLQIAEAVGAELKKHKIILAGIDVIGDYITEINITSPGGLQYLKNLYGMSPEKDYWDAVENRHCEEQSDAAI